MAGMARRPVAAMLCIVACFLAPCKSWSPIQQQARNSMLASSRTSTRIHSSSLFDRSSIVDENDIFRTFLNQCCIQSFMFLLRTARDPHTIRWLDNFTSPALSEWAWKPASPEFNVNYDDGSSVSNSNLMDQSVASEMLRYHGLGAINTTLFATWEDYFLELLQQPDATLIIETWDPRVPEYTVDISPASLCSRMLSVREQIAREFVNDLGAIATFGEQIFAQYWEEINLSREKLQAEREAAESNGSIGAEGSTPSSSTEGELKDPIKGFATQNLIFLEWHPLYDESAAPSPLRKGNFDLLVLLATQEAVHRLIKEGVEDETPEQEIESTEFLRNFYAERFVSHFSGPQPYRRADDFIEELMLSPPRVVTKDDKVVIVNPLNVAELLLIKRDKVASEWQQIAKEAPQEHAEVRRMQLDRQMGRPMVEEDEKTAEEKEETGRSEWQ
mmetsp:Transcript_3213/g.7041  ORF Transcript_3213/g.7041 Transcript_3213/m.7041 type:complete len:445 (+) Transcript_3213:48-1382(+)